MSSVRFHLNGQAIEAQDVDAHSTLLRWLRDEQRLTGTKEGCAEGDCGACTVVLVDPLGEEGPTLRAVNSCLMLTASLEGQLLYTVEGLKEADGTPHVVQSKMVDHLGSQCGYCTPGFVVALEALFTENTDPTNEEIDRCLGSNICRCTGYTKIIAAARLARERSNGRTS